MSERSEHRLQNNLNGNHINGSRGLANISEQDTIVPYLAKFCKALKQMKKCLLLLCRRGKNAFLRNTIFKQ